MGNYIDSNLTRNEEVLYEADVSWWSQLLLLTIGILTLIAGVGVIFIIIAVLRVKSTELALTDKRVIAKTGLISRSSIELKVDRIESIMIDQSIMGRIFNFGSIVVNGTGGHGAPIPFISNPMEFKMAVNEYSDEIASAQGVMPVRRAVVEEVAVPVITTKPCPHCQTEIHKKAIFCKHCNTALE